MDCENSSGIIRVVTGENLSATSSFLGTKGVNLDARDEAGRTVLHIAAKQGDAANMMILLRDGHVDINATDSQGPTPLSYHGLSPLTMLLLRQNINISAADSGGQTALFHEAKAGNEQATGLPLNCPD